MHAFFLSGLSIECLELPGRPAPVPCQARWAAAGQAPAPGGRRSSEAAAVCAASPPWREASAAEREPSPPCSQSAASPCPRAGPEAAAGARR